MLQQQQERKLKKIIGLRNTVLLKEQKQWHYLFFYDIDGEPDFGSFVELQQQLAEYTSYILYTTKHGYHIVGLTPLSAYAWAKLYELAQALIPNFYAGQTIRVSLKEDEKQKLVSAVMRKPCLDNLFRLYARRFDLKGHVSTLLNYSLVFEKYWTYNR